MRMNTARQSIRTHESAVAKHINPEQQLKRSVLSCLLWEKEFYEDGESIADRIETFANQCSTEFVSKLAVQARTEYKLRHAPLMLLLNLIKRGGKEVSRAIFETVNRVDEIPELLSLYWRKGKRPLSKQMKLGLARAFGKFNEYQFAKYNRPNEIKLRDVMFLVHAKPTKDREDLYKRLANNELVLPDTWESRMAGGQDKKEVFTDLLKSGKLGYMALLRNLRGMTEVGVDQGLITKAIEENNSSAVLPYRFISAAKYAPRFERALDNAMVKTLESMKKLPGRTALLVDVSGSMEWGLSSKSDLNRIDAACGLSILLSGICEDLRVFTFSVNVVEVPPRKGMALRDAVMGSQPHLGTYLGKAVKAIDERVDYDRLIVITDEQSHDRVGDCKGRGYMINVASAKNGVGYHSWTHIDGFSEACVAFIQEQEAVNQETH